MSQHGHYEGEIKVGLPVLIESIKGIDFDNPDSKHSEGQEDLDEMFVNNRVFDTRKDMEKATGISIPDDWCYIKDEGLLIIVNHTSSAGWGWEERYTFLKDLKVKDDGMDIITGTQDQENTSYYIIAPGYAAFLKIHHIEIAKTQWRAWKKLHGQSGPSGL